MEKADITEWFGDSEERFVEEVITKISEIQANLNQYAEREYSERVAPLHDSNYILVYKKEYYLDPKTSEQKSKLLIIDVRQSY